MRAGLLGPVQQATTGRSSPRDLAIAIHAHCIGRKDDAGPQGKFYLDDNTAFTADSRSSSQAVAYAPRDGRTEFEVRKLTPVEQEALQGFPAGYTAVPIQTCPKKRVSKNFAETRWRANGDAWDLLLCDTSRYEALGNSFPVPVIQWIGKSLDRAVTASRQAAA